ncbi:4Fe-4S binding protein [Eggerthella sp. YY7918]|uniref:4Fe-4S binding protein n=1 Tax=Eggerthella sp. (strain YY7918) TaxID=502558 RepID=UPI00021717A0|nr:4Fe-4S binding protein [Eggerthella sp. YY7918]BAK44528.1 formate hydrogenlyase subunit 6 [Eggerthella sp. YY7918]
MGGFKLGKMTFGSMFKKPETILYPVVTKEMPAGLKGHIVNDVDLCILCGICQKRCPTGALHVDKPARTWSIDRFRCVQCGSCVRECPKDSLAMEPTYTPPATHKHIDTFDVPEAPKREKAVKAADEA